MTFAFQAFIQMIKLSHYVIFKFIKNTLSLSVWWLEQENFSNTAHIASAGSRNIAIKFVFKAGDFSWKFDEFDEFFHIRCIRIIEFDSLIWYIFTKMRYRKIKPCRKNAPALMMMVEQNQKQIEMLCTKISWKPLFNAFFYLIFHLHCTIWIGSRVKLRFHRGVWTAIYTLKHLPLCNFKWCWIKLTESRGRDSGEFFFKCQFWRWITNWHLALNKLFRSGMRKLISHMRY